MPEVDQLNKKEPGERRAPGQAPAKALTAFLALAILYVVTCRGLNAQQFSSNRLAVGSQSKVAQVALTINLPSDLNFKSKADILELRKRYMYEHQELLCYQYTPTNSIFESIEDGKPWWGLEGDMLFGSGEKSILGAAEESRFLNNPYVLVAANINVSRFAFNDSKYADLDDFARRSGAPMCLMPSAAIIYTQPCREDVTYNVSEWLRNQERIMETKFKLEEAPFDLVAYNARDLGYNFIQVDSRFSKGLDKPPAHIIPISQFIHCGGSCGYPGGCNNMSPGIRELDQFHLTCLPAQAVVYLWRQKPGNNPTADFVVVINFQ
jgi:hypothetical protein